MNPGFVQEVNADYHSLTPMGLFQIYSINVDSLHPTSNQPLSFRGTNDISLTLQVLFSVDPQDTLPKTNKIGPLKRDPSPKTEMIQLPTLHLSMVRFASGCDW